MKSIHKVYAVVLGAASVCGGCGGSSDGSANAERVGRQASALASPSAALLPELAPTPNAVASTVPQNGDVNPYGVAFVPPGFPAGGLLHPGDILVANFNDSDNLQGTGTTIVRANPNGAPSLFFSDRRAPGFSTALGVLQRGFVLVGNLPSTDGSGVCTESDAGAEQDVGHGALLVINREGRLVQTLQDAALLDGPWDLTIEDGVDHAQVFVSNALSGSVTRLDLEVNAQDVHVVNATRIASGYVHRCDPAAFVVGPTGLALDAASDVLYVASAGDNAIFAVRHASTTRADRGRGTLVVTDPTHLHGPLGLARTPDGDLISAQGDAVNFDPNQPSEIVEFTSTGTFVAEFSIDPAPGSAFGLALDARHGILRFAAVDDGNNVLDEWTAP